MPNGGKLTIKTISEGAYVSLIVEDTGIGMSEEIMKQIFMPFFTTKEIGEGTGLGLSVVHGIVSSHKGVIKVESKVGAGSRFEIRFPVTTPLEKKESK
jgi:signal transduction histidine kinase